MLQEARKKRRTDNLAFFCTDKTFLLIKLSADISRFTDYITRLLGKIVFEGKRAELW